MDKEDELYTSFHEAHPRLDITTEITHQGFEKLEKK